MRVRTFQLRLVAAALVVGWATTAILVVLAYRPGGPMDAAVGLTALLPIGIALIGLMWPPLAHGHRSYPAMVWLGIGALLCLIPSIGGLVNQLLSLGSRTLLPSAEAGYPWLLALVATSLFSGFGLAYRILGGASMRGRRLLAGMGIATALTLLSGIVFTAAVLANERALRGAVPASSRFGPTAMSRQPPACDGPLVAGATATEHLEIDGWVDLRPLGSVELDGIRDGPDVRWLAYVASDRVLGSYGVARVGDQAWTRSPDHAWRPATPAEAADATLDRWVLQTVLNDRFRATAEDRGLETLEGARARHCRIAIDGLAFGTAFPQVRWLVGDIDLHRWRGQLDYWVFEDGELGQVTAGANGEAGDIRTDALLANLQVRLTATSRGANAAVYPPAP
ncbi:MAG: hypothetical protein ACJ761_08115 [Chloroflexota bacterium]